MVKIKIILGATRPDRFGIQPAQWLMEQASERTDAEFELVDLQKIDLPFFDEPLPPAAGNYQHDHTKDWSKIVDDADGYIFVTSEYNHSFPASVKNAIDFAYHEWSNKPVAFVSYGAEAGGARAIEQLRPVVSWTGMFDIAEHVIIPNYRNQLNKQGNFSPTQEQNKKASKLFESLIFWSEKFQSARKELVAKS